MFSSGLRQLRASQALTFPAVAGLALSIGATTAIFSVVHAVLLQSIGLQDTARLVSLWPSDAKRGQTHVEACFADLEDWEKETGLIEQAALASSVNLDVPMYDGGEPQQVDTTTVTGDFFQLLGARPAAGRLLNKEDDRPGAPLNLVLSYRLWKARYAADPQVIGRKLRNGESVGTVVGVTRSDFDFPRDVDVFVPLRAAWPDVATQKTFRVFRAVAKLRTGVTLAEARARLSTLASQSARIRGADSGVADVLVTPLLDEIYGPARRAVWMLLGAVMLVLLIACANVANLLLAQATVRNRELMVRAALGASRGHLLTMLLGESVILALIAGTAGLLLAIGGVRVLSATAPADIPGLDAIALNGPVLLFGTLISVATVAVFGLGPALIATRGDVSGQLRQGGRSSTSGSAQVGSRQWLVGAEIALSVILLVGAGLLIRSFQALSSVDPGFRPENVLTFRLTTSTGSQEERRALYGSVLERVRSLPGVQSAAAILLRPLSGLVGWDTVYRVEGQTITDAAANPNGNYEAISPQYFETLGIRMRAGRDFGPSDTETAPGVVIINATTAQRHWPEGGAVGRRLRLSADPKAPWLSVVGVVNDVRYREWEASRPDFYVPYTQRAQHRTDFVIRTQGDPGILAEAVRREVFAIDPNQPISQVTTMERIVSRVLARSRLTGLVLTALAVCALGLAALGIYGLLSYTVARRTPEIGVRMAVGATPASVLRLVAVGGLGPVAAGGLAGLASAAILTRIVGSMLYETSPFDVWSWLGSVMLLLATACAACLLPAWQATRIDAARSLSRE
ncbi:MAG: ABC transporter permease [Bryobacteraceae bacterium]|nr:ABC transporter permease [Bryobacteraceae bacterium]